MILQNMSDRSRADSPERAWDHFPHEHLFVDLTSLLNIPLRRTRAGNLLACRSRSRIPGGSGTTISAIMRTSSLAARRCACQNSTSSSARAGEPSWMSRRWASGEIPVGLARLRGGGVNVVMSTGYYVEGTHPGARQDSSQEISLREWR
jgi:hypothetical protein